MIEIEIIYKKYILGGGKRTFVGALKITKRSLASENGSAINAMAKNRDNDTARNPFFLVSNKQEPLRKESHGSFARSKFKLFF
ncbi:hypothetical protein BBG47_23175 [Paenibacillus sp. KS1]|nr:hypothetical protein BBG47_23175 [Paenibacillus sp. KS1]